MTKYNSVFKRFGRNYKHKSSANYPVPKIEPNVVVELLKLLFRILEVPVSNLGPEARYPD
jgi:hypothetical protein